jgi:hypothetical protein
VGRAKEPSDRFLAPWISALTLQGTRTVQFFESPRDRYPVRIREASTQDDSRRIYDAVGSVAGAGDTGEGRGKWKGYVEVWMRNAKDPGRPPNRVK